MENEVISEEVSRPETLCGRTYRLKIPNHDSAFYVTVNDMVLNKGQDNEYAVPFEIFINARKMESYQWIVALTRIISSNFRKGGNIIHICDELEQVFDSDGGYFYKGTWYNSIVAHLGSVLRTHMIELGISDN